MLDGCISLSSSRIPRFSSDGRSSWRTFLTNPVVGCGTMRPHRWTTVGSPAGSNASSIIMMAGHPSFAKVRSKRSLNNSWANPL